MKIDLYIFFTQNLYFVNKFSKVCKDIVHFHNLFFHLSSINEDKFLIIFDTSAQNWLTVSKPPSKGQLSFSLTTFFLSVTNSWKLKLFKGGVNIISIIGGATLFIILKSSVTKNLLVICDVYIPIFLPSISASELISSSKIILSKNSCALFIMLLDVPERNAQISGQ